MCEAGEEKELAESNHRTVPVAESIGMVLAHDITGILPGEFKGRAFSKGHVVRKEDICKLRKLGKERLFILKIADDQMHEDEAVVALADALAGDGTCVQGSPKEGKLELVAERDGLLKVDKEALLEFNMLGQVMCATRHSGTVVSRGQRVAGTRAIPLVIKRSKVDDAVAAARGTSASGVVEVREMLKPRAGVVITGNEVYQSRIKDEFASVIKDKIKEYDGEVVGVYYAPDDKAFIKQRLQELIRAGADLLITTGGMSVDPDDVTRFAVKELGADGIAYGSPVLPGAMFLVAYINGSGPLKKDIPILGIPACGMYSKRTVLDLVLPRVLAGERIGRRELSELGHGGLCLQCDECRWPVCPFGK